MGRFLLFLIAVFAAVAWFGGELKVPTGAELKGFGRSIVVAQPPDEPAPGTQPKTTAEGLTLRRQPAGHFLVGGRINGQPVSFVVDTGATAVALTIEDARRAGLEFNPARFANIGVGASGPVRGQFLRLDRVEVAGREARRVQGAVIEGLTVSLLGQSYLSELEEVSLRGDTMVLR